MVERDDGATEERVARHAPWQIIDGTWVLMITGIGGDCFALCRCTPIGGEGGVMLADERLREIGGLSAACRNLYNFPAADAIDELLADRATLISDLDVLSQRACVAERAAEQYRAEVERLTADLATATRRLGDEAHAQGVLAGIIVGFLCRIGGADATCGYLGPGGGDRAAADLERAAEKIERLTATVADYEVTLRAVIVDITETADETGSKKGNYTIERSVLRSSLMYHTLGPAAALARHASGPADSEGSERR